MPQQYKSLVTFRRKSTEAQFAKLPTFAVLRLSTKTARLPQYHHIRADTARPVDLMAQSSSPVETLTVRSRRLRGTLQNAHPNVN
jgi:hypothetical protein